MSLTINKYQDSVSNDFGTQTSEENLRSTTDESTYSLTAKSSLPTWEARYAPTYVLSAELTSLTGWQHVTTNGDVTVTSKSGIDPASPNLVAYKATMTGVTGVTIDQMYRAIWNKEKSIGKMEGSALMIADVLATGASKKTCYQVYDAPWPVDNRHNIMSMTLEKKSTTSLRIIFEATLLSHWTGTTPPSLTSAEECTVNQGYWDLDLTTGEFTQVILANAGGGIPDWLASALTKSVMPDNLRRFLAYAQTL